MSSYFGHMSPTEAQFVKAYVLALKRNYEEFSTTLQLMRAEVGVKCPARASLLSRELQEMQADCEHQLARVSTQHRMRLRHIEPPPSMEELVKLVQVSFFKLIDPGNSKHATPDDKGWFSGHPFEWEQHWQQVNKPKEPAPVNQMTSLLNAFMKLLGWKDDWKPSTLHEFPFKKLPPWSSNMHEDYEAYDDDEDDSDDLDYYDED